MCTAGWWLFGFGFVFPILWLVAMAYVWCGQENRRSNRYAAVASAIAFLSYVMITVWIFRSSR